MGANDNIAMAPGFTLGHVIAVIDDLLDECHDFGEDLKSISIPMTMFELKLLRDAVRSHGDK